jgi:hypothetical protein
MAPQLIKKYWFLSCVFLFSFNCESEKNKDEKSVNSEKRVSDNHQSFIIDRQAVADSVGKSLFSLPIDKGLIENEAITEASGLAASRQNKGLFWTHNDSKDPNRLFLFDENGKDKGTFFIENATNRDWEDLDIMTINNTPHLYIADIGDNDEKHEKKYIYRVKEPKIPVSNKPIVDTLRGTEKITIKYPDANRNAEALMIDQKTYDIYIVSKFEDSVQVYRIPYPQSTTQANMAQLVTKLPIKYVTAGTISPDNQEILIKNLDTVFYWKRKKQESIGDALKRPATILPYNKEPQGEAIAFAADGKGYFTLSEIKKKIKPRLYFYKKL